MEECKLGLKEKWKKFKDELATQKEQSKAVLKAKWDIGAEQGKALKEEHRKKVKKLVKKDE